MKKCKSCQKEIDDKATKCPYCQTDQRSWFRRHPILTVLIALFVLPAVLNSLSSGSSKPKEPEPSPKSEQSPVSYEIGYASGFLVAISVPQGTTKSQLKELLNYFHSLKEKSKLSEVMGGHTVIDIFDDKKWIIKENYDSLTKDMQYCSYIRATYSVDIDGVERAGIGEGSCPNYEEVIKPSSLAPANGDSFRANVRFTGTQFVISNFDNSDCQNAKMEINGGIIRSGYVLDGYTLGAGKTYEVGALQFAKNDGTRLNPFEVKPKDFYIMCRGNNVLDGKSWLGEF